MKLEKLMRSEGVKFMRKTENGMVYMRKIHSIYKRSTLIGILESMCAGNIVRAVQNVTRYCDHMTVPRLDWVHI